jgi:transcriptional regulator with XRE-family HTH domain
MNLAARIRQARQRLGITQTELAQVLGVHRSSVAHWEGVKRINPGHDRLADLARICCVSYEWLATGRGTMKLSHDLSGDIPAGFGKLVYDPQTIRLLRAWETISSRLRTSLLEHVEQLAAQRKRKRSRAGSIIKLQNGYFDRDTGLPR